MALARGRSRVARACAGCGQDFYPWRGNPGIYCSKVCQGADRSGADHPAWIGGLSPRPDGRWIIRCRDGSKVYYYRAVVEAEMGRPLRPDEIVHHIDGDHTNDDLSNLTVTSRSAHIETHRAELIAGRWA